MKPSISLLFFSPRIVSQFQFTTIKFEPCDKGWLGGPGGRLRDDTLAGNVSCLYNVNRFAKVSAKNTKGNQKACVCGCFGECL